MNVSPKYLMKLVEKIDKILWKEFETYNNVNFYIKKWQIFGNEGDSNFRISYNEGGKINLKETLHDLDNEILIKIAVDLGIETPDFIPSIPLIKNSLKENYSSAFDAFDKAIKQVEFSPDIAIGLANSVLESIIKNILKNDDIKTKWNEKDTLYKLTEQLLKEFQLFPIASMPIEIKTIGSSLLTLSQTIEKLRSNKTNLHGKLTKDYVIKESLYSYFIINIVASIGLFLIRFYEKQYGKLETNETENISDINSIDIPF